jgi:hypothetical protein
VFVSNSREEVNRKMRGAGRGKTRGWLLAATVAAMLVAAVASGEGRDPCRTAYLASGLSQQQVTFEEFGELYGEGLCAPPDAVAQAEQGERRALRAATRRACVDRPEDRN